MQDDYVQRHAESDREKSCDIDREIQKQQAMSRYRRLKNLEESELSIEDELFVQNFQIAMRLLWGVKIVDCLDSEK